MGNYRITIEGMGCHHNEPENPGDADAIARDAAHRLVANGHVLTRATIEVPNTDGTCVEQLESPRLGRSLYSIPPAYPRRDPRVPMLRFFDYEHLPTGLQPISRMFAEIARWLAANHQIENSAEKTVALRKLLEAKDAAVRAALPPEV